MAHWRAARDARHDTALAVIISTQGSTYRKRGAMALFDSSGLLHGALSGGCLEPELERRAKIVLASRTPERWTFDTEPDADRVFGSGLGCRGRIETLLLPLPFDSRATLLAALDLASGEATRLEVTVSLEEASLGAGTARTGSWTAAWRADGRETTTIPHAPSESASLAISPPRALLLLGAGPETSALIGFARRLGWTTTVVEHRRRWSEPARDAGADDVHELHPGEPSATLAARRFDAALVMSHSFESDREHLGRWLATAVPYIGLLGPAARRDELLKELGTSLEGLDGRLFAPIGLPLGGHGPEAIALAIVAQLQQRFTRDRD